MKTLDFAVPVVGQPFTVHSVIPYVCLTCNCEAKTVVVLVGLQAQAVCDACRRVFSLVTISHDPNTGQMGAGVHVGRAQ